MSLLTSRVWCSSMSDFTANDLDDVTLRKDDSRSGKDDRGKTQLLIKQKIALVSRQWTARAAKLFKATGYTNAQRAPLYLLRKVPGGMTEAELAAGLELSEPTLSRRIARLLEEGLVSKHRLLGDGRANLIKLEPPGEQALDRSDATAARDRNLLFQGVSDEDLNVVLRVLTLLASRIAEPIEPAASDAANADDDMAQAG